jgi:CheY-like chemotaxis protein
MSRILVIEDERSVRENLVELLTLEGYDTVSAENGQSGFFLATTEEFDLVICDILMPLLDGFEVVKRIRKHPRGQTLPVIFLTAKTQRESMREGMDLGADDFISKPFTRKELLNSIQTRLLKQRASESAFQSRINHFESNISWYLPLEIMHPLEEIRDSAELLFKPENNAGELVPAKVGQKLHSTALQLIETIRKYLFLYDLEAFSENHNRALQISSVQDAGHFIEEIIVDKQIALCVYPYTVFSLKSSEDELSRLIEIIIQIISSSAEQGRPCSLEMITDETKEWVNLIFSFLPKNERIVNRSDSSMETLSKGIDRDLLILSRIVGLMDGQMVSTIDQSNRMNLMIRLHGSIDE